MILALLALIGGLALLVWSADRFVDGAAATARHLGMPALLIGMVIIGFGTSAPEMVVSAFAAAGGNPGLAIGNAYGSNIANIALILGLTALISPVAVHSSILRKELPILAGVTALAAWQMYNRDITRLDAWILLGVFALIMFWTIREGLKNRGDTLEAQAVQEIDIKEMPLGKALLWLLIGLVLLIGSSRLLVWGAVSIARHFGVSDLVIGLTIVAIGTSLPELASSLAAIRKNEHDLALGNIIGSNLFNTLAVVGIAGAIHPLVVGPEVFRRDVMVMAALTLSLFVFGFGFKKQGRINRVEGGLLLLSYAGYTFWLIRAAIAGTAG